MAEMMKEEAKQNLESGNRHKSRALWCALAIAYLALIWLAVANHSLGQRIATVEDNTAKMEDTLARRVDDNRKIYVYNMEETLLAAGIPASSQKFETDIASLEKELADAKEKIKTLKEAQVQEEFSDMYLRSLKLRRDDLISKYSESMQSVLNSINQALEEVARENNVHTIFLSSAIAISTEYVVDVTPQVIEKMKQQTSGNQQQQQ